MSTQRQRPDGTWGPAEPIPWRPGIDWEVYGKRGERRTAVAYDRDREVARVTGRGLLFALRLRLARRGLRTAR